MVLLASHFLLKTIKSEKREVNKMLTHVLDLGFLSFPRLITPLSLEAMLYY